jgi:hypothetical protein
MADITHPQAVKFCNEEIRPLAASETFTVDFTTSALTMA